MSASSVKSVVAHAESFGLADNKETLVAFALGFAKPLPKEEVDSLVQKWKTQIWPSVTKMIGYSGGPFVGGSVPNIGELACFGYLNGLLLAKEDHPIFTSDLKEYILAMRKHFTSYEKLWSGELFKRFYAPK